MALELADGITLYFCRHGETQANVEGRFQGWEKDTALTAKGREQAGALAAILKRERPDFSTLAFVASPLPRACRTMEIIRKGLALPPDGFETDGRICEIDLGAWDGLTHAEARALDPVAYERREGDKWDVHVPGGGENYAEVARRIEDWVGSLKADTFAVSHGALTRILRGLFAGMGWKQMSALDEPQGCLFRVRGGEVVRIDARR
jgi:probable phosphoglycerate mutase